MCAYVPAAHGAHAGRSLGFFGVIKPCPTGQLIQLVAPVAVFGTVPAGHAVHADEPGADQVPIGQTVQAALATVRAVPALHEQKVDPARDHSLRDEHTHAEVSIDKHEA